MTPRPPIKRWLPTLANLAAIVLVLYVYTFFGSVGRMEFHHVRWDARIGAPAEGYYSSLAEGFLRGQVSMAHRPDPRLMAMPDPYDFAARKGKVPFLWDASYLNGKYYLYFSPLPALLFYIPYRLVGGAYPLDQLAGTVFAAWAFVMAVAFLRRALSNRTLHVPLPIWIVTLGLASIVPFVLPYSRTYEVAIFCGAAMTSTWAYALLRFFETSATRWLIWSSVWMALAIAARPNLGILLPVFAAAIVMVRRRDLLKAAALAMAPLAVMAIALLIYNYARFLDPFEFGYRYQLTYMSMAEHDVCGIRSVPELLRFLNSAWLYTFMTPFLYGRFPFADLTASPSDPGVSFAAMSDQVAGLAALAPLAMLGTLSAVVLALRRSEKDAGQRAGMLITGAGWLALFGLCTCWFVSARYEIDFWFLISAGGIICLEAGLTLLADSGVNVRPLRVAIIAVALVSSIVGFMLGFRGTIGSFPHHNPELYQRLSSWFT